MFPAVTARDGKDHEGVLVRQRSSQTDGPAHQENPVPAQRGGGRQDVSVEKQKARWRRTTRPHSYRKQTLKTDCK